MWSAREEEKGKRRMVVMKSGKQMGNFTVIQIVQSRYNNHNSNLLGLIGSTNRADQQSSAIVSLRFS